MNELDFPLSDKFNSWSRYHYATNNPINIIDYDGRDTVPATSKARVTPLPVARAPTATPAATSTSSGGSGGIISSVAQRAFGVLAFLLMPANGSQSYDQGIPSQNLERFVTDPSSLDDQYLAGVRERISNGTASTQDYVYASEAFSRIKRL